MGSFSKDQSTSVPEALSGRLQSPACLPGNQSLSINQYPDWLIPPYSPSHPVCRHFVFPELPCCWSYSGTELTKLKHEFMQLCLCEGKEGGSRMQKAQIMLLPYHGPFSKPLIFCHSSLLKSQHGLLAGWDAFLCTHAPWCLYIITLSSHANSQHPCHH